MFRFRLKSVLRLREHKEKACRDDVARCIQLLNSAQKREKIISQQILELLQTQKKIQEGTITVSALLLTADYLHYQKERHILQKQLVRTKMDELQEARARLFEAMKQKKIMTKLQDKRLNEYNYAQAKIEQAILDDLANRTLKR